LELSIKIIEKLDNAILIIKSVKRK
jgi:hypothetical protein